MAGTSQVAKRMLGVSVLEAARARVSWVFDSFPRIFVSFSGGKDSTAMLHLVMAEAKRRGRKVGVLFLDWEAQFVLTIAHVEDLFSLYSEHIEPHWVALPLTTTNAVSQVEPEWTCWDPAKRDLWVRHPPNIAVTDPSVYPFHYPTITFEEFVTEFAEWYSERDGGGTTAAFVGIRAAESLHRWRAIAKKRKSRLGGKAWTAWKGGQVFNVYPIFDWRTADVWTYFARFSLPYNGLYDRMHQAGITPHNMRICEPYGDEQRRGLWLFHAVEPETWAKVCARVAGANSGALYAGERGNVLGNHKVTLPNGHTWQSFAEFLLATMPRSTADHYRAKIDVYMAFCRSKDLAVPDCADNDTGGKDVPSWRRVCKVLLRNDYWCKGLSFSPTKAEHYTKWRKIVDKRRVKWASQ